MLIIIRVIHHLVPQADGIFIIFIVGIAHRCPYPKKIVTIFGARVKSLCPALGRFIILPVGKARVKPKLATSIKAPL
jgi:hypothetical protein